MTQYDWGVFVRSSVMVYVCVLYYNAYMCTCASQMLPCVCGSLCVAVRDVVCTLHKPGAEGLLHCRARCISRERQKDMRVYLCLQAAHTFLAVMCRL